MMMFGDLGDLGDPGDPGYPGYIATRLRVTGVVHLLLRPQMRADRSQHEAATPTE
jgi:hypothetical protein